MAGMRRTFRLPPTLIYDQRGASIHWPKDHCPKGQSRPSSRELKKNSLSSEGLEFETHISSFGLFGRIPARNFNGHGSILREVEECLD